MVAVLLLAATPMVAPISIETRGETLPKFAERLSEASREQHRISDELAKEVVIVRLKERTPFEVRERIARVMHAEWVKLDDVWRLQRSADQGRWVLERHRSILVDAFRKEKERLRKFVEPLNDPETRAIAYVNHLRKLQADLEDGVGVVDSAFNPDHETLAHHIAAELIQSLPNDTLAKIPYRGFEVYSDRPTGTQSEINPPAGWREQFDRSAGRVYDLISSDATPNQTFYGGRYVAERLAARSPTAQLNFSLWRLPDMWAFSIAVYGSNDQFIDLSRRRLPIESRSATNHLVSGQASLSATSRELFDATPQDNIQRWPVEPNFRPLIRLSRELREGMLNPEETDPLSYYAADAVFGLSAEVVACLPDKTHDTARRCIRSGAIDLSAFVSELQSRGEADVRESDGVLELSPYDRLLCELERISRSGIGMLLRAAAAKGAFEMREFFVFCASEWPSASRIAIQLDLQLALIASGIKPYAYHDPGSHASALLGSLSDQQYRALLAGGSFDLSSQAFARARAWELMNQGFGSAQRDEGADPKDTPDLLRTGTERFPAGIVPGVVLRTDARRRQVVMTTERTLFEAGQSRAMDLHVALEAQMSVEEAAIHIAQILNANMYGSVEEFMSKRYVLGEEVHIDACIPFMPGARVRIDWKERAVFPPDATPMSYRELPADFREELEREVALWREKLRGGD